MARLVQYTPEHFDALRRAAERVEQAASLCHQPFVDHYYVSSRHAALHLLLDGDGAVLGTVGVERMPFEVDGAAVTLGFGSNFYAFQPGAGGYLFMQWVRSCPLALVFGGSPDTHRILRQQEWTYCSGVRVYELNRPFRRRPGESAWRSVARRVVLATRRKSMGKVRAGIPADVRARLSVAEVNDYAEDMLPPSSPFRVRFAPDVEYLRWRYLPGLSFVRYRPFRILDGGKPAGYVILNEQRERLIVAHCDGTNPADLACGVLLSLAEAAGEDEPPKAGSLACSHPAMQHVYENAGFRPAAAERPLAIGGGTSAERFPADTSQWLVNLDWGDNGLRAPFLDQQPERQSQGVNA
jgi:hypothetical protein